MNTLDFILIYELRSVSTQSPLMMIRTDAFAYSARCDFAVHAAEATGRTVTYGVL